MVRVLFLVCVGCGRLAFESAPDGRTADAIDLDAGISSAQLIHDYSLMGTLADGRGGPAATSLGGTIGAGGYVFGANQGLVLTSVVPSSAYTIDLTFQLTTVTGYRKIIDFKMLSADEGLYATDQKLQHVEVAITGCPGTSCYTSTDNVDASVIVQVTFTRAIDGTVTGYINKAQQFSFVDSMMVAIFDRPNAEVNLFVDDTYTGGNEASDGTVYRIRVFDGPLSAADVALL